MTLQIDFNAVAVAVKTILAADIASSTTGSLGNLGATTVLTYGETPANGSDAVLPFLSIQPYVRDPGKRIDTTGTLIGVDGIQVNVDAPTVTKRATLTSRVVALIQGQKVTVSTGGQPFPIGLEAKTIVSFDNEATFKGITYHRNAIRFEQREFRHA